MVDYFDYRPGLLRHRDEIDRAIARVLDSGQLVLGPEGAAFEREFAEYVGSPHAVGVGSGTDALVLALRALGIGPGDEVITVANAGVPPVAAIRATGAIPRFVDVRADSRVMDPDLLGAAITGRTRAILPVHLYGQPADLDAISRCASDGGLHLLEDCAQAHGALYRGAHVGGTGSFGCFSFYPTKNLGALGDGGMAVTGDAARAEQLGMLRMYGYRGDRHAHCEGLMSRLDELQAAVLRVGLRHLDESLAARRALARQYREGLVGCGYALPHEIEGTTHAYHVFVIEAPERTRVTDALKRAGIGFAIHYPEPVHQMEAYGFLGYGAGDLPVSEASASRVLSLPLYPGLAAEDVDRVIEVLRSAA